MSSHLQPLASHQITRHHRTARRRCRQLPTALLVIACLGVGLAGCGGDNPPPSQTAADVDSSDQTATAAAPAPQPEPSIRPLEDDPSAAVSTDRRQSASARDEEYTVTPNDCMALAKAYGRSWQNDEMDKLNAKNLKPAQHERVAGQIRDGAREAHDNWLSECQNLVDSAMLYGRLACATKAKSLQRFNDCWDGKVQE